MAEIGEDFRHASAPSARGLCLIARQGLATARFGQRREFEQILRRAQDGPTASFLRRHLVLARPAEIAMLSGVPPNRTVAATGRKPGPIALSPARPGSCTSHVDGNEPDPNASRRNSRNDDGPGPGCGCGRGWTR